MKPKDGDDFQKYQDMLDLPHHVSSTHPPMSMAERAAQFAPFSALTGYGEAVKERARITGTRLRLDEGEMERINRMLLWLKEHASEKPEAVFTYFQEDSRKEGGAYVRIEGRVGKISEGEGKIVMEDGRTVPITDLSNIELKEL